MAEKLNLGLLFFFYYGFQGHLQIAMHIYSNTSTSMLDFQPALLDRRSVGSFAEKSVLVPPLGDMMHFFCKHII